MKAFFKNVYRDIFTREFDTYDDVESNKIASLTGKCTFCDIIMDHSKFGDAIWYEDEHILIFDDKKPKATMHGLCIPKRHIRDIN